MLSSITTTSPKTQMRAGQTPILKVMVYGLNNAVATFEKIRELSLTGRRNYQISRTQKHPKQTS